MYDEVTKITVERTASGWDIFPWNAEGEAEAIKAPTEAVARLIVRDVRRGRRGIPVRWLRQ